MKANTNLSVPLSQYIKFYCSTPFWKAKNPHIDMSEVKITKLDIMQDSYNIYLRGHTQCFTTVHRPAVVGDIVYIIKKDKYGAFNSNNYVGKCFKVSSRYNSNMFEPLDKDMFTPGVLIGFGRSKWKLNDDQYLTLQSLESLEI